MAEITDNKLITKKYLDEYNKVLCNSIVKMVDNQTSQSIGTLGDSKFIEENEGGILNLHHRENIGEESIVVLTDNGTETTIKNDMNVEKSISVGDSIVASNEVLRTKFKNNYIGLAGEDLAISTVNIIDAQVIERHVESKLTMNVFQAKVDENKRIKTPAIAIGKHTDSSNTLESAICIGEINEESLGAPTYFAINYPTINTPSISGGNISNATLTGVTLDGTISGSIISGGTISEVTLDGTITNGGTISGGTISGATLNDCTINNLPDIKIFNLMLKIDNTRATAINTVKATLNYDGQTNSYFKVSISGLTLESGWSI